MEGWLTVALFGTGLAAGFVDSIAGGGGLLTLPALLWAGLPAPLALGTNKLQASFGSGTAAWNYTRLGTVALKECATGVVFTFIGAALGTLLVQELNLDFLRRALPVLLLTVAAVVLFKPEMGSKDVHPRFSGTWFYAVAGLGLGFYDGFFGPGTGTFWTMAFMLGLGFNLTKATGYTKVMNFTSNLVALILFWRLGQIQIVDGLVMGGGQLIGARIGSGMVVARGTRFIRPIFLTVVMALAVKLLWRG